MAGYFDLFIGDEVQEFKAKGSAQGLAAGSLAEACGKALTLTGTIAGGYSSTLFYLLYRFSPLIRREFGYHEEGKWIGRYGILERITKKDPDAYTEDGRQSRRRNFVTRTVERPGISPAALFHLISQTVFLRLSDVSQSLPSYKERVMLVPLDQEGWNEATSQAKAYHQLARELRQAVVKALREGSKRLLATYLQSLLAYPDGCCKGETVVDRATGSVLACAPALPEEVLYPKERALVDLVRRERERGRRVLVYVTHTETRDITPRLSALLQREGFRVAVLKANTVAPDRREEWVAARVREGLDVMLAHPRLLSTGLDLVEFASVVWLQVDYSVYTVRQASRRVWRIGQNAPVEVTFMVYEGTLQAEALALVAAKARASLMIEGDLPEEGLAALQPDGGDVYLALARRLAEAGAAGGTHAQSLEALFAEARLREDDDDRPLVDTRWEDDLDSQVEPTEVHALTGIGSATDLQRFGSTEATGPASDEQQTAKVVTFEELAGLLRRRRVRPKPVPEGQLTLFGS